MDKQKGFSTRSIHGGIEWKDMYPHPVNAPIFASSTFAFPSVDYGARVFSGDEPDGYTYGRLANPTIKDVEMRIAALEGGEECVVLGSGMAAVASLTLALLKAGDHLVADKTLYGGTHSLFTHKLPDMGIEVTFVDASDPKNVEDAIKENTKLIYFETPTNPVLRLVPIKPIAEIGKKHGILTAIDNTFMSPVLCRPIEMGIDIVLHSATKYLNGQSDLIAGALISTHELVAEFRMEAVHLGGILGPFEGYLLGRGLKTLKLRVLQADKNAMEVARYLENHSMVKKVYYPGLESHPQHELAKEQQEGFGSMMGFELDGDFELTKAFVDSLHMITRAVSLGGVETLISHPSSTTHSIVSEEDRALAGISDTYMRLAVGIEDVEDIIADLEQAFAAIKRIAPHAAD